MSITQPAVSQAGSQTTSHRRERDEWRDLEEVHNKSLFCDSDLQRIGKFRRDEPEQRKEKEEPSGTKT